MSLMGFGHISEGAFLRRSMHQMAFLCINMQGITLAHLGAHVYSGTLLTTGTLQ